MRHFVLSPPTHINSCSRQKYMNNIMRRCSNFSRQRGSLVCGLLAVEHQLSWAPGASKAVGGRALWVVSDVRGRAPRSQADRADQQGLDFSKGQTSLPPHGSPGSRAPETARGADAGVGSGRGWRAGPGVCRGPTHRSWALGAEPSRPLPAVPLLEHAASCTELLLGGGAQRADSGLVNPQSRAGGPGPAT